MGRPALLSHSPCTLPLPHSHSCSGLTAHHPTRLRPQQHRTYKAFCTVRVSYGSHSKFKIIKKSVYSRQNCLKINDTFEPELYSGFESGVRKIMNSQLSGKQEHWLILLFHKPKSALFHPSDDQAVGSQGTSQPICQLLETGQMGRKPGREAGWVLFSGLETTQKGAVLLHQQLPEARHGIRKLSTSCPSKLLLSLLQRRL